MDKITLLALKKSGAVDVSAVQAAKEAAQEAAEDAETAQAAAESAAASLTIDSALSDSSTNAVQNKVVNAAVSNLLSQISASQIVVQSESKPIVQIADGSANNAKSYDVQIAPVQDLHGYDHPWPAGGGKNLWNGKFVDSVYFNETDSYSGNYPGNNAMPITVGETYTASINGVTAGIRYVFLDSAKQAIGSMTNADTTIAAPNDAVYLQWRIRVEATENGKYQIESGSTATAWTPYSNICPISGWTGAEVGVAGKNICSTTIGRYTWANGVRYNNTSDAYCAFSEKVAVKGGETITVSFSNTGTTSSVYFGWMRDNEYLGQTNVAVSPYTATAPDNANYVTITFRNVENYSGNPTVSNVVLEYGTTATPYEPYSGSDYSISFPQSAGTVYGGSLHVNEDGSGTLVVDKGFYSCSGDTGLTKYTADSSGAMRFMISSFAVTKNSDATVICSHYRYSTQASSGRFLIGDNTKVSVWVEQQEISELKAYFAAQLTAGTPVQFCYVLAEPQTYTLTAPQIALLLGENNVWADTGDMAVEYVADTKLYIQTLTGHPDEDMIADANITSGSFFMVGNRLFISTSAIASGETIVPGTNCTETNLAAALNTINAD